MTSNQPETIAFLGASTGVGLAALKAVLASGRRCIALCRTPSKLSGLQSSNPNLEIVPGNAHDGEAVSKCLLAGPGVLVDQVISTIGGAFIASKMTIDDPNVCRKGMAVLLETIASLRENGAAGRPRINVYSTTGLSQFGRDIPLAMVPLYHVMLKVPHQDKIIMEDALVNSGELFTIVRGSLMVSDKETDKPIRVGIEDPETGRESDAIGYTISKSDAGRWMAEHLVMRRDEKYLNKIATITQ